MSLLQVNSSNFDAEVLQHDGLVLVDFFAPWCGPCMSLLPTIEEAAKNYDGKCKIVKVNVDDSQEVAMKYGIMSIPALKMFNKGELIDEKMGALPAADLSAWIDGLIG